MDTRRRAVFAILIGSALMIAVPGLATAQADSALSPDAPVPITWCSTPAENAEWKRTTVYLSLGIDAPDTASRVRTLRGFLPFVLSGIASAFMADLEPGRKPGDRTNDDLPRGDPRYGPPEMFTAVRFDLMGDGTVDSVDAWGRQGSLLKEDLMSALLATIARGDVFGPYADSSVRTRLFLRVTSDSMLGAARWPAFTMNLPVDRPPRWIAGQRPEYPPGGIGWRGLLRFQFDIDVDGQVAPGSIRNVVPVESVKWETTRHRRAYEAFAAEVERTLMRMRYEPALFGGCRMRTRAVQDFQFGSDP